MNADFPLVLILIVCGLAALFFLFIGIRLGIRLGCLRAEKQFRSRLDTERGDAVKRSRAVLGGQFSEQLAPFLPGFPGDPTEVRFIGKPVDFISFSGASGGNVSEVVFIEVKTGESRLSPVERSLRNAIERGHVRYVEYRVPDSRNQASE